MASFLGGRLGTDIAPAEARGILERLGFEVSGEDGSQWRVRVPSWRATKDISIREDLVEEVGRLHGYDKIRPLAPQWPVAAAAANEHRRFERSAKLFLSLHGGLDEVFTYSMVGAGHCRAFGLDPEAHLKLKNPITEDMDRMRREIVPLHLEKAHENQRYLQRFGFFELARIYRKPKERLREPELPQERNRLAGLLSFAEKRPENFHEVRHLVLSLLAWLRLDQVEVASFAPGAALSSWIHPSVAARILAGGKEQGSFYRVHPFIEQRLELKGDVLAFDLDLDGLFESPRRPIKYRAPSRYPTVAFDVAVVAPARTPVAAIQRAVEAASGELLQLVGVFDVFEGGQLGAGKKSVAFHLVFGSAERTLGSEEVTAIQNRVISALEAAGYPLR